MTNCTAHSQHYKHIDQGFRLQSCVCVFYFNVQLVLQVRIHHKHTACTYTGLTEPVFHACIGMIVAVFALTNLIQLKQCHN